MGRVYCLLWLVESVNSRASIGGKKMNANAELWAGVAALLLASVAVFALYQWRQIRRVRQVETWVKEYLSLRFGETPNHLRINCSNDRLWPVLVDFNSPRTETRYDMQFTCPGPKSTLSLISEKESRTNPTHARLVL
jgi:hypothetical protein